MISCLRTVLSERLLRKQSKIIAYIMKSMIIRLTCCGLDVQGVFFYHRKPAVIIYGDSVGIFYAYG